MELTICQSLGIALYPGKAESFARTKFLSDELISTSKQITWTRNAFYISIAITIILTIATNCHAHPGIALARNISMGLNLFLVIPLSLLLIDMHIHIDVANKRATVEEVRPGIIIPRKRMGLEFNQVIKESLEKIAKNRVGQRLFQKLEKNKAKIFIVPGEFSVQGYKGSSLYIGISLTQNSSYHTLDGSIQQRPIHVTLFHELVHAYHAITGKRTTSTLIDPLIWTNDVEYKTIMGFPLKKGKKTAKITENAFLKAEGLPERIGHVISSQDLYKKRACFIGKKYQKWRNENPDNLGPPPILKVSPEDFEENYDGVIKIKDKDKEGNKSSYLSSIKYDEMTVPSSSSFFKIKQNNLTSVYKRICPTLFKQGYSPISISIHKLRKEEADCLPATA